jgi:myo-inositol-1(or 4)-monophosphatase
MLEKKIIKYIKEAGDIFSIAFDKSKIVKTKSNSFDLVTETDKKIELFLKQKLSQLIPESQFLSEETDSAFKKSKYVWIIDPIDGTTNFVHKFPFACISVALQVDNELKYGIVYNPILNEFFFASKNQGAYLNESKITVNTETDFSKTLLATGFAYNFNSAKENNIRFFENILPQVHGIRRPGSAALDLAYVAKGVYDGFWEWFLNPWDVCAGILLITEAGGIVSNIEKNEWRFEDKLIIAGSKNIQPILLKSIQNIL